MSKGRWKKIEQGPVTKPIELTYIEKLRTKQFKSVFVPDGEIIEVIVKSCHWRYELANTIQLAMQIGFDSFLAIDYQDEAMPWLRFIFLRQNIEIKITKSE